MISFLILCLIYWAVPKGHLPWRAVWPGALFMAIAGGIANSIFPLYLVNVSTVGEFGRIVSFVLVVLIWFYALALGLLAGAVINALRFELHATGTVRGMTAEFPAQRAAGRASPSTTGCPDRRPGRLRRAPRPLSRIASSSGVGSTSNSSMPLGSSTTVSVVRPSTSGLATPASTGSRARSSASSASARARGTPIRGRGRRPCASAQRSSRPAVGGDLAAADLDLPAGRRGHVEARRRDRRRRRRRRSAGSWSSSSSASPSPAAGGPGRRSFAATRCPSRSRSRRGSR